MRKFTLFVALFAALTVSAKNLPIKIAGFQATTENIETLVKDSINNEVVFDASGKISYDEAYNLLVFDNFFFTAKEADNKVVGLEIEKSGGLNILLKGDNAITCSTPIFLKELAHIEVIGAGKLGVTCTKESKGAIVMGDQSTLQFGYTTFSVYDTISSAFVAEKGDAAKKITLAFNHSNIDVTFSHLPSVKGYAVENIDSISVVYSDVKFSRNNGTDDQLNALRVSKINLLMSNLSVSQAEEYTFDPAEKNYKNQYSNKPLLELTWSRDLTDELHKVSIGGVFNDISKKSYDWKNDNVLSNGSAILRNDTLFLKDVRISPTQGKTGITIFNKNIIIHLSGENEISAKSSAGIYSLANSVDFVGDGSLRVIGLNAGILCPHGVWMKGDPYSPTVYAGGDEYGFMNPVETDAGWTLMVDKGADFSAHGNKKALFLNNTNKTTKGLDLRYGTLIAEPYYTENVFEADYVRFATPEWTASVEIAGKPIHAFNYYHLDEMLRADTLDRSVDKLSIVYDPSASNDKPSVLRFTNAWVKFSSESEIPFLKVDEDLDIMIEGGTQINLSINKANDFLATGGKVAIIGSNYNREDKLTVAGLEEAGQGEAFARLDNGADLKLHYLTVETYNMSYALRGVNKTAKNAVRFSYLDAKLQAKQEVCSNIAELTFDNAEIVDPEDAKFSEELRGIVVEDKLLSNATLQIYAPVWTALIEIEGKPINSLNYYKLAKLVNAAKLDKNKEMNVYYDHDKSELIFRNAKIEWADAKNAPFLKVEQMLTIVAEGENTIEMTSAKEFIHALNHVIIKGEEPSVNKLVAYGITYAQYADKEPYSGIFAYLGQTGSLAISNVTVGADYFESAIVGSTGDSHSVTFEKASVGMFVSKEATKEITEMNFIECAITKPAGAEFSPELRGIALNGQLVFGETVTIRPVSEGIENTMVNGGNQKFFRDGQLFILRGDKTYTVQGQEVK